MYDFRTLSPLDFKLLVRDLLQAETGVRFESFGPGRDLGIDFRFAQGDGDAVVQAKHYIDSPVDAVIRAARAENDKVEKLKPARYLFATSASLSPLSKKRIIEAMPDARLSSEDIFGRADLNNLLGRHKEIEKKHFKLRLASTPVLERILHSGVYNRTEMEMELIKAVVPKFVQNESVLQSEKILAEQGSLIIAGEPGVGKSTLARMLVWLHAEQGWLISVIDDINDVFDISTAPEEKRLIFFDDFLGQVRLSDDLIRSVDQRLPPFIEKIKASKNLRFVLTTRNYILHQAQAQSSRLSSHRVKLSEFVLNVGIYTRAIRSQILFNHLYFSTISRDERSAVLEDDFFLKVIDHKNFNPRLIDLLTTSDYVSLAGRPVRETIVSVLDNPRELWEKPYRSHISAEGRALMLAQFFSDERISLDSLENIFYRIVHALGLQFPQSEFSVRFRSALRELEGSVLAIRNRSVTFSNPGVRDYLQRAIVEDKLLIPVLDVLTRYKEIDQAWVYFLSLPPSAIPLGARDAWVRTARRIMEGAGGATLQNLELLIDLYDHFKDADLIEPIKFIASEIEEYEIESDEVARCSDLFEKITLSTLPHEIIDNIRSAFSAKVGDMIRYNGSWIELNDLSRITRNLRSYGDVSDETEESAREAIEGYIADLEEALSQVSSTYELGRYERDLSGLMEEFGVSDFSVDERIEIRRGELQEEEDRDEASFESTQPTKLAGHISDDEIRSMFAEMVDDKDAAEQM